MKLFKKNITAAILVSVLFLGLAIAIGFRSEFFTSYFAFAHVKDSKSAEVSVNTAAPDTSLSNSNVVISASVPAKDTNTTLNKDNAAKQTSAETDTNAVVNTDSKSSNSVDTASKPAAASQPSSKSSSPAPAVSAQKPAQPAPTPTQPAPAQPAPKPSPPSIPTSTKLILGYATYYYSGDASSYNSMTSHSSLINELVTHTYITDATGNLYIQGPFPTTQVSYANNHGIKALAIVRNEFSSSVASSVLNNPDYKNNLVNSILNAVKQNNYKGVNIDFEILKASDRDAYTNFVKEVYNTLHPLGYMVTIALPAKTFDSAQAYWTYPYDYAQLGNYADQVILMTYDYSYPGGKPGPIAPLNWVQQVVNYAVSVIPRSKILLGLAAYGYDWPASGGNTISYGIQAAYDNASKYGAEVKLDSTAQVPYYNYTNSNGEARSVYFENSTSIGYKLNIVNNSNLLGAAIWRLGLEDENYWTTIRTKLNK